MFTIIALVLWIVAGIMQAALQSNHRECSWSSYWTAYLMIIVLLIEKIVVG